MRRPQFVEMIKKSIRNTCPTAEVILFGSEARGDARSDSDIDVLILPDVDIISWEMRQKIEDPLYEMWIDYGIEVNPLLIPRNQWYNRPFVTPFYINVIKEGIKL